MKDLFSCKIFLIFFFMLLIILKNELMLLYFYFNILYTNITFDKSINK